jgi:hypothetical protein
MREKLPCPEVRQRRVSKDACRRTNGAAFWSILRDAALRAAPQDEVRDAALGAAPQDEGCDAVLRAAPQDEGVGDGARRFGSASE